MQRNLSSDRNPARGLMAVVSGGAHVHSHASGMALELYGAGQVLGANAGKGTYTTDEHENHRRLFAAYNTVIVNGASRSAGGWVNLGINTVEKISLEPAIGAAPVSPSHSFTLTRFADDRGEGAKAKQERLVGLVRTSPTTGYYVDVFRSKSALPDEFHDYLYHNIGESTALTTKAGALTLAPSSGRFVPTAGAKWDHNRSYLFPGWHVFKSTQTSAPVADDVSVLFTAKKTSPVPAHMRLFIPGAEGRDYSQALAPSTKEAPGSYEKLPTPVVIIRQRGEAWTRPFAVIYEPFAGADNSGSIQSVTGLRSRGTFAGFKVTSRVASRTLTQLILTLPRTDSVYEDPALGLSFQGRYAIVTLDDHDTPVSLYVGEGTRLRVRSYELTTLVAAFADLAGPTPTLRANTSSFLVLPDGSTISGLLTARP